MRVLLVLLAASASAAELPITDIDLHPDGALITRAGHVPVDDLTITGLPTDCVAQSLEVVVDGLGPVAARVVMNEPIDRQLDAEEQAAHDAVVDRIMNANAAIGRLQLRRRLVLAVLDSPPPRQAMDPIPSMPDAAQQTALMTFAGEAMHAITSEWVDALAEVAAAEAEQQALDEHIAGKERVASGILVRLPSSAAGKAVRLRYRVDGPSWLPTYRVSVHGRETTLHRDVIVRWTAEDAVHGARVRCHGLRLHRDPVLTPLAVPVLGAQGAVAGLLVPRGTPASDYAFYAIGAGGGAAGVFGSRSGGGKKRAVSRFGGSRASESSVSASSGWFHQQQRADGSFHAGPSAVMDTALATMTFLGAGYDHKTPSRHRTVIAKAIEWLSAQDLRQLKLVEHACALNALAEAFAMSNDPVLHDPVRRGWESLTQRVQSNEIQQWLDRREPFAGPEVLAWIAFAAKAVETGGVAVAPAVRQRIIALAGLLPGHADRDAARAVGLLVDMYLAGGTPRLAPAEVQRLAGQAATWYRRGRVDLLHFYSLALFQIGGQEWQRWNVGVRELLVQRQAADGSWDTPHPGGIITATALATLSLEIYYRYTPAHSLSVASTVASVVDSQGWPVLWEMTGQTLAPRSVMTIPVASDSLSGALRHQAIPIRDGAVWRRFDGTNPIPGILPPGTMALTIDGSTLPSVQMHLIAPGAALTIPLGSDPRLQVRRETDVKSDDRGRSREITATLTYTLAAPPEFTDTVEILEPLPREIDGRIEVRIVDPPLHGGALDERVQRDPIWRTGLVAGATATLTYRLRLAGDLRPYFEYLP